MVAHCEQIPAQLGLMQFALGAALLEHGGSLAPGDAILTNNPYLGGTHTNDLQVFVPVHVDGVLVAYAGSIAHHIDVGGTYPGTESPLTTEIYQEGVIFPAIKYVEAGRRNDAVAAIVAANVRDPHSTMGDIGAQLAACKRRHRAGPGLCARHGRETVLEVMNLLLADTEVRAAALFSSWPDRAVTVEGFMDGGIDDAPPTRIRVTVRASSGRLAVDFTGTSDQVPTGLNVPLASTHAGVYFAVRCFAGDSGVRQNDGMTRLVDVVAPPGSLVNPIHPAPLSARHLAVQRIADLMVEALGELMPERAVAGSHVSFPAWTLRAYDGRWGKETILADILGEARGHGATPTATMRSTPTPATAPSSRRRSPSWSTRGASSAPSSVDGSGGEGRHRGGMALRRDITLLADVADGSHYVEQCRREFAAKGRAGGSAGAPAIVRLRRAGETEFTTIPGKAYLRYRRGDTISFTSSGGGGYGVPEG